MRHTTHCGRAIPFRLARPPLNVTGLDRSGLLVRMIDRRGTPFFLPRSRFERYALGGNLEG